jgi:hypothetical protein
VLGLKPRAPIPRKRITLMDISSNAEVQVKRRFNVDIANCNYMLKRPLRIGTVDACIWLDLPTGNRDVLVNVHILVADREYWFEPNDILTNVYKGPGVALRVDQIRVGTKHTYSFQNWEVFEVFLSRLPKSMPSGKVTYIVGGDGLPVEVDDFFNHLNEGSGAYTSVSTSASALKNLRRHMRNLGIAA